MISTARSRREVFRLTEESAGVEEEADLQRDDALTVEPVTCQVLGAKAIRMQCLARREIQPPNLQTTFE